MHHPSSSSRRRFLAHSCTAAAGLFAWTVSAPRGQAAAPSEPEAAHPQSNIFKSVKWGMIQIDGTVQKKFELMKQLGYDGIEMDSPTDVDLDAAVTASRATGLPIHGVVDSVHWKERLSSPDPATRERGRGALEQAIRDTHYLGGSAVLLVPGRVTDGESHADVWQRSIGEIRQVLPLAAFHGIRILIENVWNGFCETPEELRDYLDEIVSPWVGSYFDIGNVRKFGPSEDWIRVLGHRIVKLDVKDWGQANGFCKIGDGDVNWPAVRKALQEIGFCGWCTAEVTGGGRERLQEIAQRIDRSLGLGPRQG